MPIALTRRPPLRAIHVLGPLALVGRAALAQQSADAGAAGASTTVGDSVRISLGGYLQADGRLAGGPVSGNDGVLLRRARLTLEAAGRGGWMLRLQPDFGQGRAQVQDGFVAWSGGVAGGELEARAGRFRPPYGVERALSSSTLLFPERSLINAFMPNRLFGVEVRVQRGHWGATAGAFQAAGLSDALVDTDGDPVGVAQAGADAVLRATWRPFGAPSTDASPPLELQAGGMLGRYRGDDPEFTGVERFLTTALRPALAWREAEVDDGSDATFADGTRQRGTVGAQAVRGPVHLLMEGAWLAQRVRRSSTPAVGGPVIDRALLRHAGWHVRASWLQGGTRTADNEVRPRAPGGAVELGVRAAGARFDPASVRFADPEANARALTGAGVALAWVPRPSTRLAASVDVTRLTAAPGAAPRGTERAAIVRVQQGFR